MLDVNPLTIHPDELIARVKRVVEEAETVPASPTDPESAWQRSCRSLDEAIKRLSLHWAVAPAPISSGRRFIGPLLILARKALRALLRWYVEERWERQAALNQSTAQATADLRALVAELASRLEASEAATRRLEAELAQWRDNRPPAP